MYVFWLAVLALTLLLPVSSSALTLTGTGSGSSIVQDEGVAQGAFHTINCAGDGVACAITSGVLEISVSGVGGGALEDPGGNGLVNRPGLTQRRYTDHTARVQRTYCYQVRTDTLRSNRVCTPQTHKGRSP